MPDFGDGVGSQIWADDALRFQTARAAAVLAGAWDAAPTELHCEALQQALLYVSYTRGAVNGAMDLQVQVSPDAGATWYAVTVYAAGAVVINVDTASNLQRDIVTYGAVGAATETFVYGPLFLAGGVEMIRVPCRESGVVGTPGTCEVKVRFE